jgi:hypothetical protein
VKIGWKAMLRNGTISKRGEGSAVFGADEGDLVTTIAVVFGEIRDPKKRLRAVKAGREALNEVAQVAVAECRRSGLSWRAIAYALGEAPATSYRHHGKVDREIEGESSGEVTAQGGTTGIRSHKPSVPLSGHVPGEEGDGDDLPELRHDLRRRSHPT